MNSMVSIGASSNVDALRDRLYLEAKNLQKRGVNLVLSTREAGDITFLGCNLIPAAHGSGAENQGWAIRQYLAQTVSDLIVTKWEELLLSKLINYQKNYFSPEERQQILKRAQRYLELTDGFVVPAMGEHAVLPSQCLNNRCNKIRQELTAYLRNHNELIIDGFLRFRLKGYINQLGQAVDSAIEELLMEREYQDFIRLLQYFVEIQEPRASQVHVVLRPTGTFQIYDSRGEPVENEYQDSFLLDVVDTDLNYEDLLISALITIAPQQITIHQAELERASVSIETIQKVFDGRVLVCRGCERCKLYSRQ